MCAFLNGRGGRVVIGVTAKGMIVGQQVTDSTLRDVASMLDRFEPPGRIGIERVVLGCGREIILLEAPAGHGRIPFSFCGRAYHRVGTTTSLMPQELYQQLLIERAHHQYRWENRPTRSVEVDDLDGEEIMRTVRMGIETGRLPESTGSDLGDILDRLKLRQQGRLLNAAMVLFGTELHPCFTQCQLRLARFRGKDKTGFLDNQQLHGHAFKLLEASMTFLMRHLPLSGRFEPGRLERIDEPLFPIAALREAVINALCHRTYIHAGGAVSLSVYDDRLEIWSDGILPFGLLPEDLKKPHDSRPRNPLIAGVFYRRGLIEQWGRGTEKIVKLCVDAGHPEPEFGVQAGSVWVRFVPGSYMAPNGVVHDLTERQRSILNIIGRVETIPLREIMSRLENPPSSITVRDDLYQLKQIGIIDSKGHGRSAVWFLRSSSGE